MRYEPIVSVWIMGIICVVFIAAGIVLTNKYARGVSAKKKFIVNLRRVLVMALIFVISLRPQVPNGKVTTVKKEMDLQVLIVLDNTISMLANDYAEGGLRLDGAKEDLKYIVEELYGSSFSILGFNNDVTMLSPYTDNSNYIEEVIDVVYPLPDLYATGTTLNIVIAPMENSLENITRKGAKNIAVFFVSDGEITKDEELESFRNIAAYADFGAVLGYGSEKGGTMKVKYAYSDEEYDVMSNDYMNYGPAVSRINEENLKSIANDIGVSYINMNSGDRTALNEVLSGIKSTTTTSESVETKDGYEDIYYWFVIPLALLLLWSYLELLLNKKDRVIL